MKKINEVIPAQYKGAASETTHSIRTSSVEEARELYSSAKTNLLAVNNWKRLAGKGSGDFHLTDKNGHALPGPAKKGDYLKIDIPGPGTAGSKGYDWVKVEEIEEGSIESKSDWVIMKVRPVEQPSKHTGEITHFFDGNATSNFFVKRDQLTVTAAVIGRNESPNIKVENLWSKIRNAVTGFLGLAGLNKPQWKMLVKGILTN